MTLEDLGRRYGKNLVLEQHEQALPPVWVVHEVDEFGELESVWGQGFSPDEAVRNTALIFQTSRIPEAPKPTAEDAWLAVARTLPSETLKRVLVERGDLK